MGRGLFGRQSGSDSLHTLSRRLEIGLVSCDFSESYLHVIRQYEGFLHVGPVAEVTIGSSHGKVRNDERQPDKS